LQIGEEQKAIEVAPATIPVRREAPAPAPETAPEKVQTPEKVEV
jgi:hypothetical protein